MVKLANVFGTIAYGICIVVLYSFYLIIGISILISSPEELQGQICIKILKLYIIICLSIQIFLIFLFFVIKFITNSFDPIKKFRYEKIIDIVRLILMCILNLIISSIGMYLNFTQKSCPEEQLKSYVLLTAIISGSIVVFLVIFYIYYQRTKILIANNEKDNLQEHNLGEILEANGM